MRRGLSIRARLTLWYGAALLAALGALVVGIRLEVQRTLEAEFAADEQRAASLLRQFFQLEIAEYQQVEPTLSHITAEVVFPDRHVRFRTPEGQVFSPAGADRRVALPTPVRVRREPLDPLRAPGWEIELSSSATSLEASRRRLDLRFLLALPLVTLAAAVGGWWLTGRTLRPVWQMAEAADAFAAEPGGARLPIANPADELGRLGTSFNRLLDRLETALVQQRRFLADAAHELRTPIARMRSTTDVARLAPPGPDDRAALETVAQDLVRTSDLLNELLQLARADADPTPVQRVPLFLDDVVADALGTWRAAARQAEVALDASRLEETPITGDAALLQRLFGILLDNAIRYTPAGGSIDVRVGLENGRAVLEVADTGIGLPPEGAAALFARFHRGAEARRRAPDGSGLGLPIAAWIARQHAGVLSLTPRDGGGTVARLEVATAV